MVTRVRVEVMGIVSDSVNIMEHDLECITCTAIKNLNNIKDN